MPSYDHLPLKKLEGVLERRKHGFGTSPTRDHRQHGARIEREVEETLEDFNQLPAIEGVDPSLILKINLASVVDEDEWRKLGLAILSVDEDQSVVLFANDTELREFRRKVEAYQGELPLGQKGPAFAGLIAAIERVGLLGAEDRIGPVLMELGYTSPTDFSEAQLYILDVELHRPADQSTADLFVYRLQQAIAPAGGVILNSYSGQSILIARIEVTGGGVRAALKLPEVASIDEPPQADIAHEDIEGLDIGDVSPGAPPPPGAPVIGIIDSGLNSGHPLIAPAFAGYVTVIPAGGDADQAGHGTSVASIAVFGDIHSRALMDAIDPDFACASAKVTTANGAFPRALTLPALMDAAVRRLHDEFGCRIFNLSLGDPKRVYKGGKPEAWAGALDQLARDLNVLIIVSAGNRKNLNAFGDQILAEYPAYLCSDESRIVEPATAANALTIGAIAHSNGLENADEELAGVRPICAADEPSPFTRCGPGVRGMIKPDFVDYGGTAVWDGPTISVVSGSQKAAAGIWAMSHEPVTRLFQARSGTSFAAPNIANKAAAILARFPDATANLMRSLLAVSAEVPGATIDRLSGLTEKEARMIHGYGVPQPDAAVGSDDDRVVLYTEDELQLDHFAVYEVPIPYDFQTTPGTREVRVSLAFDPPVRHTRIDYLGATMAWRLLRGASEGEVFDRFRKWTKDEGSPPDFPPRYQCGTDIGPTLRERGTLQCATFTAKRDMSAYGNKYFLAVWCNRRWAPAIVESQRFAVAVQLRHENLTTLYQRLTQPVRVRV